MGLRQHHKSLPATEAVCLVAQQSVALDIEALAPTFRLRFRISQNPGLQNQTAWGRRPRRAPPWAGPLQKGRVSALRDRSGVRAVDPLRGFPLLTRGARRKEDRLCPCFYQDLGWKHIRSNRLVRSNCWRRCYQCQRLSHARRAETLGFGVEQAAIGTRKAIGLQGPLQGLRLQERREAGQGPLTGRRARKGSEGRPDMIFQIRRDGDFFPREDGGDPFRRPTPLAAQPRYS